MTSSRTVAVRGAQRPRVELIPTAAYTDLGDDAVALCDAVGLHLDPWQAYVVRGMFGERLDGKFAAPRVGIVIPRQQGKGVILEARALAGLFLLRERYIIWTAHELKTAQAAFLRLREWIDGSPDLSKHVKQMYTGNTENSIVLKDGRTVRFLARTAGSGRGLTADCLILDEAYALKDQEVAALLPTLTTSKNPQTVYTSSAGMPGSEVLSELRERGMDRSSKGLAYFEWSAPDDADPDDMDALIAANPGLGKRLSLDHVAAERESLSDEKFKRERLGIWAKIGGESAIPSSAWGRCLDEDSVAGAAVSFAVDVPPSRDVASIAAVSEREDGRVHVEIVDQIALPLVPQCLALLKEQWNPRAIVVDAGSAAGSLLPEIKAAGVRTLQISPRDYGLACANVYDAIMARELAHTGQVELDDAVAVAVTKPFQSETLWKWNRSTQLGDISPLVAVTLAWHGHQAKAKKASTKPGSGWKVVGLG